MARKTAQRFSRTPRKARRDESPPPVGVVDVVERDADGDLFVRLAKGDPDGPMWRLAPGAGEASAGAPGLGDRLLVRFERLEDASLEARLIKHLGQSAHRILGVVRKARREIRVEPVDRKSRDSVLIPPSEGADLRDGDLVLVQIGTEGRRPQGPKSGRVLERVGREDDPRAASLLAIHAHGIPTGFSPGAQAEADAAKPPTLKGRTDLRDLPLVTIDPPDARDHDDAVYAQVDDDPKNPGGWVVWVAIADVAAYVRPGSALDHEAREKGNSVYFPDRVEPMLPETLSAGLCSLIEREARACLAVRMVFDTEGRKRSHRFSRGLMRSAAKLSYEQAQTAIDGRPDDTTGPLMEAVLRPLWAAYGVMKTARDKRSPVEIDSVERRIVLGADGKVASISPRASLEAHKLIEECMIQANVCAAETLEQRRSPLIYRVHDAPSEAKLQALADFLATLAIPWNKGEAARTERFNRLLEQTRGGPHFEIVNEVVLRTQMQAIYSPENIGHFGLNLDRYAHFTSPIRRYADLIVHRSLITALGLGDDGLSGEDVARLKETAEHITLAERRAMAAERDATDRYVAAFLEDKTGADFAGRITGVTRFGLFVRLSETGADGLVPVSSLGDDYFVHDEGISRPGRRAHRDPLAAGAHGRGPAEGGDPYHRRPDPGDAQRAGSASEPEPRDPNASTATTESVSGGAAALTRAGPSEPRIRRLAAESNVRWMPDMPPKTPRMQVAEATDDHHPEVPALSICGRAAGRGTARAMRNPRTSGSRKAFITWTPTFSDTRFGRDRHGQRRADDRQRINSVEPARLQRMVFEGMAVAGDLAQAPGQGQRRDDRRHQAGADDAQPEHQAPYPDPEVGGQGGAQIADRRQIGFRAIPRQGGGGGHEHGGHDQLGDQSAERGVPARGGEMFGPQLFVGDGGLLVEHHPRHDHRADVGGHQVHVVVVGHRDLHGLTWRRRSGRGGPPRPPQRRRIRTGRPRWRPARRAGRIQSGRSARRPPAASGRVIQRDTP